MTRPRCFLAVVLVVASLAFAAPVGAQGDDIPDQCRTIIGCADAGPKPENPGDRGGYAQLLTLVVLMSGVGFIGFKIARAARASQAGAPGVTENG